MFGWSCRGARVLGSCACVLLVTPTAFAQGFPIDPPAAPAPAAPTPVPVAPAPAPVAPAPPAAPVPAARAAPIQAPLVAPTAPNVALEEPPQTPSPARLWPVLPYREGMPIPRGYQVEHRPASGLIWTGALTMAAGYLVGIGIALDDSFSGDLGWLAVPVVGAWPAIGSVELACTATTPEEGQACLDAGTNRATTIAVLAVDGMIQTTGLLLFIAGMLSGHEELVRTTPVRVSASPRREGGLEFGVTGRF